MFLEKEMSHVFQISEKMKKITFAYSIMPRPEYEMKGCYRNQRTIILWKFVFHKNWFPISSTFDLQLETQFTKRMTQYDEFFF